MAINGRGESLCFSAMPEMRRAIWSAPPPVPAGITNSIGLFCFKAHALTENETVTRNAKPKNVLVMGLPPCWTGDGRFYHPEGKEVNGLLSASIGAKDLS